MRSKTRLYSCTTGRICSSLHLLQLARQELAMLHVSPKLQAGPDSNRLHPGASNICSEWYTYAQITRHSSDRFDPISSGSLSACLVQYGDNARIAFVEADANLMFIKSASQMALRKVGNPSSEIPKVISHEICSCPTSLLQSVMRLRRGDCSNHR